MSFWHPHGASPTSGYPALCYKLERIKKKGFNIHHPRPSNRNRMAPPETPPPTISPPFRREDRRRELGDALRIALKCHARMETVTHNLRSGFHRGMASWAFPWCSSPILNPCALRRNSPG